jgi:hypothetical protein
VSKGDGRKLAPGSLRGFFFDLSNPRIGFGGRLKEFPVGLGVEFEESFHGYLGACERWSRLYVIRVRAALQNPRAR